ncbi:MAG: outer membrane protein transport protein [Bacteroidetes bacterium]|nr:outer membrane protein transport protein [Bacteroidota bacterium]
MKFFLGLLFIAGLGLHAQSAEDAIRPFLNQSGPGARAAAMGGSFAAIAEDYTAVFWNPAGLTQIRKMELLGGLTHAAHANRIGYQGTQTNQTNGFTNIDALGWVIPVPTVQGSLVFAFGYSRIRSFDDYNRFSGSPAVAGGQFFQDEETTLDGSLNQWSFAGAVDATEHVSLGASLNLVTGRQDANVRYFEDDSEEDVIFDVYQRDVAFDISPKYTGVDLKLGTLLKLTPSTRFAATISAPTSLSVEERSGYAETFVYDHARPDSLIGGDYFLKYHITSPWRFELAASHRYQGLLLSGALEFIDWTQTRFRSKILDEDLNDIDGQINSSILRDYRQTTNIKLGAEYMIPSLGVKLMGGFRYEPSPYKTSVENLNSNKRFLSGGISVLLDTQVKLDAAYVLGWWKQATTDNLLGYNDLGVPLTTREKIKTHRFMVTVGYRF